ncbi:hypothetical protein JCM11491_007015, partial [Sporobolomyces phaffii]
MSTLRRKTETESFDRKNQHSRQSFWSALVARLPISLEDAIRLRHPSKPLFTRPHTFKGRVTSWSRIDHILLGKTHKSTLRDAYVRFDAPASDHRPVLAVLDIPDPVGTPSLPVSSAHSTRIHPSLFSDVTFAVAFENWYSSSLRPLLDSLPSDYRWEAAKRRISSYASQYARNRYRTKEDRRLSLETQLAELESNEGPTSAFSSHWLSLHEELVALNKDKADTVFLRAAVPVFPDSRSSAQTLHRKLAARKSSSTFRSIRLPDQSQTVDLDKALAHTYSHYASQFEPSSRDQAETESSRRHFLQPVLASSPRSDPRFARRWDSAAAAQLDLPISAHEVSHAIETAPSSSSPGLLGLPYEFYKQNSKLLAQELADAFNASWERGFLQPSQTEARVRLLFKSSKANADSTSLSHYRPISLRETDYRLLARILVKRLNPLLENSIPRNQVGFVPGRQSSDAGLHLQLLIEEVQALAIPRAALLSLDQEKAYDLVDHDWILASYRAFGAPPRFLNLLTALYDRHRLVARYNINGFFTTPVPLHCGLPQGCPLSCASWLLSFQPFLDALVHRRITLSLPASIDGIRSEIFTHLAFADDSVLAVESLSNALPLLQSLADDWRLATNGRLNTSKTSAFAIGPNAHDDPDAAKLSWTPEEQFTTWAGFPLSLAPQPGDYYEHLLAKIERRCRNASRLYTSARTRALYANSHIVSLSLHSLSFYPAPQTFLKRLRAALLDFVWTSSFHPVKMGNVFLPVKKGGLGLIDPFTLDDANNLRRLNLVLSNAHPLSAPLLLLSFQRHAPPPAKDRLDNSPYLPNPWSLLRRSTLRFSHPLWKSLAETGATLD